MSSGDENIPTSAITFLQSEHGRLRRAQRGIVKRDLQAAKKYGGEFSDVNLFCIRII